MSTVHAFMIAAVVVTAIAAWQDYKTGHIANWLTLGALGLAPLAHFAVALPGGVDAAVKAGGFSVLGAIMVGLVPLILYRLGGIFGGDVKLLAAVGAMLGTTAGVEAELCAFLAAAMFALGRLAYEGKLVRTLANAGRLVVNPVLPKDKRTEVSQEMMTEMRFGPAIFVGTVMSLLVQWRPM
jgi:prepilin peptidase CpaA